MANKGKPFSDDVDHPSITFQAPERIFDRLLKESSLSDLKETVRKKLGLGSRSVIQFTQLRNGQVVDLKDENDFDAFRAVAYEQRHAMVQVVLTENTVTEESSVDTKSSMSPPFLTSANALPSTECLNANSSAFVPGGPTCHWKVVQKNEDGIEFNSETFTTKASLILPIPSVTARQNPHAMPVPIRIETTGQRPKWLEKEQKEKEAKTKASAAERAKREEEEEERRKEEDDRKKNEEDAKGGISDAPSGSASSTSPLPPTSASALPSTEHLNANSSTPDPGVAASRKKVAPRDEDGVEVNLETLTIKKTKECEDESTQEPEEGVLQPNKDAATREALRVDTVLSKKRCPGPLDLSNTRQPPSPIALARPLGNLYSITYPEGIRSPKPELNVGVKEGKFRYDRDFLMQFMSLCKEKPDSLPIGLGPVDPLSLTRGGSGRHRQLSGTSASSRQASVGGGLPGAALRGQFQCMGSFTTTRSKRREKRSEASKVSAGPQAHGPVYGQPYGASQAPNFEPIAPLQMAENRWDRKSFHNNDPDSPEVVDRKIKALLNKLTMEKFDSISDQIVQWANKSENQKDGRTLIQVLRIVFEHVTYSTWSEMYARLCRKMMEQISPKVQDEGIRNSDGNPITGGQLFRKHLLNRCQEDFERGWFAKEATAAAAATKATNDTRKSSEVALYSYEYFAAQTARRQGLGLIKFIGELFKLQMLTERIMHECIKKLLGNVQNPEEEEIEGLCVLLTTVGSLLDHQKARAHLDIYFQRMQELSKNVNPRMQSMLKDLIELRDRKWQARNTVAAPTTLAQVHEVAMQQRISMSRGGSRRRGTRDDYPQADGWNSVSHATAQAGDLSQFGRFSKAHRSPTTLRSGSLFADKEELEREAISRTSSNSNMFTAQEAHRESNKEQPLQRNKLVLQPHTKPVEDLTPSPEEYPKADRWNNVSPAAAQANDLSQFDRFSEAHRSPTTLGSGSLFAGKEEFEREAISRSSSNSNMFTTQEAHQESNKEQPTKLVEEPFFSIRNLFVTFLQTMYIVSEDDPGTLI